MVGSTALGCCAAFVGLIVAVMVSRSQWGSTIFLIVCLVFTYRAIHQLRTPRRAYGVVGLLVGGFFSFVALGSVLKNFYPELGQERREAEVASKPPSVIQADCKGFEAAIKRLDGVPDWVPVNTNGRIAELGIYWCVEASPRWHYTKDGANRVLQRRFFKLPAVGEPGPVKPENQVVIDAFTRHAEQMLCPQWRTLELESSELLAKERTLLKCR